MPTIASGPVCRQRPIEAPLVPVRQLTAAVQGALQRGTPAPLEVSFR